MANLKIVSNVLLSGLGCLFLSACSPESVDIDIKGDITVTIPEVEYVGVWKSQGSGVITKLTESSGQLYEITSVSCLKVFDGTLEELKNNVVESLDVDASNKLIVPLLAAAETLIFDKLDGLPDLCQNGGTNFSHDPEHNFEVFWHTFEEHYSYFEARNIDWQQVYMNYRSLITPTTTDEELFNLIAEILSAFEDAHISVDAVDWTFDGSATAEYNEYFSRANHPDVNQIIKNQYLGGVYSEHSSGNAYWGNINDDMGYINLSKFAGFAGNSDSRLEHDVAFQQFVIHMSQEFAGKEAIIVDVRNNNGGGDARALKLASMFADTKKLLYTEKTRHEEGFTPEVEFYSEPSTQASFGGKVAILISPISISSGEQFAMNMIPFEQAILIGETTNGALSQVSRVLPNGWRFTLTNQVVVAANGEDYEIVGIPPDLYVESFTTSDLNQRIDSAIETAIQGL